MDGFRKGVQYFRDLIHRFDEGGVAAIRDLRGEGRVEFLDQGNEAIREKSEEGKDGVLLLKGSICLKVFCDSWKVAEVLGNRWQ